MTRNGGGREGEEKEKEEEEKEREETMLIEQTQPFKAVVLNISHGSTF